nr:MAG TPA: large terminase [Caudoviricetes sp.]
MYYNMETVNKSFIDFHLYLKEKGIKNNNFMLRLHDPSLANIDPFDPLLSEEMKSKIINECKINIWFYFREILRVPCQGGGKEMFELNRANCAAISLSCLRIGNWMQRSRSTKSTLDSLSILSYYGTFFDDASILLSSKHKTDAGMNLMKFTAIINYLPDYLYDVYCSTNSTIRTVGLYSKDINIAKNLGRSLTSPIIYFDDAEYIKYLKTIIDSAEKCKETFKEKQLKTFRIYTSTVNDNIDKDLLEFIDKLPVWKDEFYDLNYTLIVPNELYFIKAKYNEIGYGEDYYKSMIVNLNKDWDIIRREVLLERKEKDSE